MKRPAAGISLLELLLALVVLSVGLLPVFDLLRRSGEAYRFSRDEVVAIHLAGEVVDQLAGMPFSQLPTLADRPLGEAEQGMLLVPGRIETRLELSALPPGYERVLTIAEVHPRLKRISCLIRWGSKPSRKHLAEVLVEWQP